MRSRDNPSTASAITRVLRAEIIGMVDGAHIGSEENLSRRFDATIRQAMRILEAEGLVTVRRGIGAVSSPYAVGASGLQFGIGVVASARCPSGAVGRRDSAR